MPSSTSREERRKAWLEAGQTLAADPATKVWCPTNRDAYLEVTDAPFRGGFERHLTCPKCGASESLLFRFPSEADEL